MSKITVTEDNHSLESYISTMRGLKAKANYFVLGQDKHVPQWLATDDQEVHTKITPLCFPFRSWRRVVMDGTLVATHEKGLCIGGYPFPHTPYFVHDALTERYSGLADWETPYAMVPVQSSFVYGLTFIGETVKSIQWEHREISYLWLIPKERFNMKELSRVIDFAFLFAMLDCEPTIVGTEKPVFHAACLAAKRMSDLEPMHMGKNNIGLFWCANRISKARDLTSLDYELRYFQARPGI